MQKYPRAKMYAYVVSNKTKENNFSRQICSTRQGILRQCEDFVMGAKVNTVVTLNLNSFFSCHQGGGHRVF